MKHFRLYLQGRKITLVTDHQSLSWLMINQSLTGGNARWAVRLQEYDFDIIYRPGVTLQHVDKLSRSPPEGPPRAPATALVLLATTMDANRRQALPEEQRGPPDVWKDGEMMAWIRGKPAGPEGAAARARARGLRYRLQGECLELLTKDGWKVVPSPEGLPAIIAKIHAGLGHFEVDWTQHLVKIKYWWQGVQADVQQWLSHCEPCKQAKAHLETSRVNLRSLPIHGLGYRWSLDIAGEAPLARGGKRYILVMIEHVNKWVEVAELSQKSAAAVAVAFSSMVLTLFGSCGEVLTHQGTDLGSLRSC